VLYNAYWPERFWAPFKAIKGKSLRIMSDDFCMSRMEIPDHPYVKGTNVTRPLCECGCSSLAKRGGCSLQGHRDPRPPLRQGHKRHPAAV
jgi:hypothetical protein